MDLDPNALLYDLACRVIQNAVLQAKLLQHGTLKLYPGFSHGMMTTHADVINADILAFIRS